MRPTVCICCRLQATDFPENKRGFQPTEAALFVQRPCLEREQMKRMLTARRMRNAPLGAGIRAKRMLTARRMRNAPAWSGGSGEENADSMQDAEHPAWSGGFSIFLFPTHRTEWLPPCLE